MLWSQLLSGLVTIPPSIREEDDIVHELCAVVDGMDDTAAIETALLDAAGWITRGGEARWAVANDGEFEGGSADVEAESSEGRSARWVFPVRGADGRKRLIVEPTPSTPPAAYRRLRTLCVVADGAIARSRARSVCRLADYGGEEIDPGMGPIALIPDRSGFWREGEFRELSPQVQDGTFLKAVLPYAVGQARRHMEPLCLLCLAIDRLPGIRELMGERVVERVVVRVGAKIVSTLRGSDVVSRMEDDRFLVILPRACLSGALSVAQKICRSIEQSPELFPEFGGLTVSVGVAEFPASAQTVYRLVEEADAALEEAQSRGRNLAVAASGASCPEALVG